ncbi:MAG: BrnA antitoxin family protein [Deltaproteobacteria bacterium]|nr:BrnA antitoxin family protein [Deltaproteobacteria bacterium]
MKKEYDFTKGKRGPVIPPIPNKTRITIRLDNDIINWFKNKVHKAGGGNYQSMINDALNKYIEEEKEPIEDVLRRVIREELQQDNATQ